MNAPGQSLVRLHPGFVKGDLVNLRSSLRCEDDVNLSVACLKRNRVGVTVRLRSGISLELVAFIAIVA